MENNSFVTFSNKEHGLLFDDSKHPEYPIRYFNIINGKGMLMEPQKSYFIYVYEGVAAVSFSGRGTYYIVEGMYFSAGEMFTFLRDSSFKAICIEVDENEKEFRKMKYNAMFLLGGPIQSEGRLNYIDGCTDSLLIPPIKLGNPCLNHLHFPSGIDQTQHTHPSHRIGIVAKGSGMCKTPFGELPLESGMIFIIKQWDGKSFAKGLDGKEYPCGQHAFQTFEGSMDVIAFHPDSDFGPTDEVHPMINRTIVDGVSASELKDIQTKS